MSAFIGRERELRALEDLYRGRASAFVPVYGRRRVGKSELILRFMRKKPHVYYVGKRAPAQLQIREFLQSAAESLGVPLLATATVDGWKKALLTVVEQWKGTGKLILALDEFQWIAEESPELASVLQECWDRHFRDSGKFVLILCGSFVGFMEREVLGRKSPLYGRRTAQIRLQPFGYREAAHFHPSYSLIDRVRTYFACGGVPHYLRCFDQERSVEMNITAMFLDPLGPLYHEPEFLTAVRYALEDPLLRFWFRFIYPVRSLLAEEGPRRSFVHRIAPQLESYFGGCFERLCREALPHLYLKSGVNAAFEVGEFWNRDTQIDLIGVREDGWTDLGECKWGTVRSAGAVLRELHAKARAFPNERNASLGFLIFTRNPVKSPPAGATCYSLEDLYAEAGLAKT